MSEDGEKKLWTWQSALVDHIRCVVRIPMMLLAPFLLTTQQMEAVQNAVSDVNDCNISKLFRREMTRLANIQGVNRIGLEVYSTYGKAFGLTDGTGNLVEDLHIEIRLSKSAMVAKSVEAVAMLQMWMDLMGNTLLGFMRGTLVCSRRKEQNVLFEVLFSLYYLPLYTFIALVYFLLRALPNDPPPGFYKFVYLITMVFETILMIPIALLGLILLPCYIFSGKEAKTLPPRQQYTALSTRSVVTSSVTYTIDLVKPYQDIKVGIRLGSNSIGQIVVTKIKEESIAASTNINVGDCIYSINGKNLPKHSPKTAAAILLSASGVVTLAGSHADLSVVDEVGTV